MPQILHPDGFDDTRSTEEQFLDLLLADEELLRAEFDAIIAAEWPGPPPIPPDRRVRGEPDPGATRRHRATATRRADPGDPGWTRRRGNAHRRPRPLTSRQEERQVIAYTGRLTQTRGDRSSRPHVSPAGV